ncbi:RICIN domain-containing protein [Streptomyces goshikiensis]|uniref:RICIN domain-containing protein n=1 Tax=Streptomyces goshikiensis TaxID=1942 RepID=UPI003719E59A
MFTSTGTHRDISDRREQQLFQPELDLFHSPELSAQALLPLLVLRQLPEPTQGVPPSLRVHGSHNLSQSPKVQQITVNNDGARNGAPVRQLEWDNVDHQKFRLDPLI